ncbi:protein phosphatase methylesterase 1-like [Gigantopelta aegis]|uniref:protein phosphatase methylesterase 1-like n=1 Tax=Gigantopelta aegis TaxID=1735272 RepID=UPI001B88CB64|nr:protein phosphatase methylesterase 1-like [Gigantopelta aegis]
MSALPKGDLKKRFALPPVPTTGPGKGCGGRKLLLKTRDYSPVYWDKYFENKHDVKTRQDDTFRVYDCGNKGPVLFFLHGGGFSALSWALLSATVSHLVTCRCAAMDLRGHGDSVTSNDKDLSLDTMSRDVADVIDVLYGDTPPQIILVGHSMGGAIAVNTANKELIPSLAGLCVIDVVEGTALDALSSMQSFLRGRPKSFKTLDMVVEWIVRTGQIKNIDSARVSMVGQVKCVDTNETASSELEQVHSSSETIIEEDEEHPGEKLPDSSPNGSSELRQNEDSSSFSAPQGPHSYTWRIDLAETEQFWKGWFQGLSQKFLSCSVPKMLILAGMDRLDKDLTIGQMQGKFQLQVLPQSGHVVHEDCPDKVADVLATYLVRHKMAEPTTDFERTVPYC